MAGPGSESTSGTSASAGSSSGSSMPATRTSGTIAMSWRRILCCSARCSASTKARPRRSIRPHLRTRPRSSTRWSIGPRRLPATRSRRSTAPASWPTPCSACGSAAGRATGRTCGNEWPSTATASRSARPPTGTWTGRGSRGRATWICGSGCGATMRGPTRATAGRNCMKPGTFSTASATCTTTSSCRQGCARFRWPMERRCRCTRTRGGWTASAPATRSSARGRATCTAISRGRVTA